MDHNFERKYHELEQNHWWFKKRRDLIVKLLKKEPKHAKILDIGCSSGQLLTNLKEASFTELSGIDVSEKAIELCQEFGHTNTFVMDGAKTSFNDNEFDLIIASDCLEHIEDDAQALKDWLRILKPGGKLICFVPAHMHLWSEHDVVNHHYRRYQKTALKALAIDTGWRPMRTGYWNSTLYVPISMVRWLQRKRKAKKAEASGDLSSPPKVVNWALKTLLSVENQMVYSFRLPVGVSTFVIAEKEK